MNNSTDHQAVHHPLTTSMAHPILLIQASFRHSLPYSYTYPAWIGTSDRLVLPECGKLQLSLQADVRSL